MKNKKIIIICIIVVVMILVGLILITGKPRTDVYLKKFEVSNDGKTMILEVDVTGSAGYIRKMKRTSGSTNGYYTFYSTYGINSKIGAKDKFEIELSEDTDEIYFYTGNKGYKLVLAKYHPTQEWKKINYPDEGKIKINLIDKENIIKVGINTMAQDNNYFEYDDKDIIEEIYNIFDNLETDIVSKNVNSEGAEEIYSILFFNDENMLLESDNDIFKTYLEIYKRNGRYYVEQRYNGIYEIAEEDFNTIKSYTK